MATTHSLTRGLGFLAMATIIAGGIAYVLRPRHVPPSPERATPAELSPEWKAVEAELAKKVRTAQTTPYHGMTFADADAVHFGKRRVWDADTYQYRQHALRFFGSLPREAQSDVLHGNTVYVSMDTDEHVWKVPYGAGETVAYYRSEWQDPNDATKQHYAIVADAISGDPDHYDWLFIPIADHIVVRSDNGRQKRLLDTMKSLHEAYRAKGELDLNDIVGLGEFNEFDLQAVPAIPSIGPRGSNYPWFKLQTGWEITFYSLLSPAQRLRAFAGTVSASTLTSDQRDALALAVIDFMRLERYFHKCPVGIYVRSRGIDAHSNALDPATFEMVDRGVYDEYDWIGGPPLTWLTGHGVISDRLNTTTEAYALPLARKAMPGASAADVARQRTHKYDLKVGVTGGYTYTIPLEVTTAITLKDLWRLRKGSRI